MITITDIERLAELSRIKLEDTEKAGLVKEIDSILTYVDQIKKATVGSDAAGVAGSSSVKNVTRPDTGVRVSDADRDVILDEAPDREGEFVAVKKIIG